jgi:hypothetical protein
MATINDVPPSDELMRPILETLRVQHSALSVAGLVDRLYDSIGLPPDEMAKLDKVLWERVGVALETLAYAHAVEAGQFDQAPKPGSPAKGWMARIKGALHFHNDGDVDTTWTITNFGRRISDHELAVAFTEQCAELATATGGGYSSPGVAMWGG